MQTINRFEDLEVWSRGREISRVVYKLVRKGTFSSDYRFVGQITAAAGSIMDNIAEGFGRQGNKEFITFLYYALGSCCEVQSQLYRALDAKHITEEEFDQAINLCRTESTKLNNFINYLKNSEIKGVRFKNADNNNIKPN